MNGLTTPKLLVSILLAVLLAGCSRTTPVPDVIEDLNDLTKISVASVGKTGVTFKAGDRFTWRRDVIWVGQNGIAVALDDPGRVGLTIAIENQFLHKGYFLGVNTPDANYEVVAATMLGDSLPADALTELARLSPGLNADGSNLARGTMLIGIARPNSKDFIWRASLQGFVAGGLTPKVRAQRFNALVASLLAELPE